MRLKIHGSHLTWKVANKCLKVRERVEEEERNEDGFSLALLFHELSMSMKQKPYRKKLPLFICLTTHFLVL